MKPSFWQSLDALARRLTPFGIAVILVLIGMIPTRLPVFAGIAPVLPLIAVYHWAAHRPRLMPPLAVFTIGVLQDVLTDAPLGLHAVVLLAVSGVVLSQRRFLIGKSFATAWLGFAVVAAGAGALAWTLVSFFHLTVVAPPMFAIQYSITVGFFPLLSWVFLRWQRSFPGSA